MRCDSPVREPGYTKGVAHELRNDEDVEAILRIAVKQTGVSGGQSLRERLNAAADELGLTPEQVAEAEKKYFIEQQEKAEFEEFRQRQRSEYFEHAGAYLGVNAVLFVVNFMTAGHITWAWWVLCAWGIGIVSGFRSALLVNSSGFQNEYRQWQKRKRRKEAKKAKNELEPLPPLDD